jgi:hypothetical protein
VNRYVVWFRWAVWLGILADWVRGFPGVVAPNWMLWLFGQAPAPDEERIWVAFASLLLVLLSFFYIPTAADPSRYRVGAWLTVLARLGCAVFFLWLYPGRHVAFGYLDLILFLLQALPLILALRLAPVPREREIMSVIRDSTSGQPFEYDGSTFAEVKAVAFSGAYDKLPFHPGLQLNLSSLVQLFNASARNLSDRRDIRPHFDKLVHPNGICFTGVWRIDRPSPYTGYFAQGSQGLLLARLSVAGPRLLSGQRRAPGIAGKVFPTMDPHQKVRPGNFVTVAHLSGVKDKHILDTIMSNQATVGWDPGVNFVSRVVFRLADTRPGYRLLHPISTLGVPHGGEVVTPDLMMLKVADGTPRVDADDFRDELRLKNYPGNKLVYTINVKSFDEDTWTQLGVLEFTEDAVSEGGDKRLHFWIPLDIPSHN